MNENQNIIDRLLRNRILTHTIFWVSLIGYSITQQYFSVFNDRPFRDIFINYMGLPPAHDIEIDSVEIPIGISYKQKVFERLQ